MEWIKKGIVLETQDLIKNLIRGGYLSHVQMPTLYRVNDDILRIYFSTRDSEFRSRPMFIDLDSHNYNVISMHTEPLLELGEIGTFDDCGIIFSSCVEFQEKLYMYYIGWNKEHTLPYTLSIGLAVSTDGGVTFTKVSKGPIMDRDFECPYFNTAPFVINEGNCLRMWYVYCTGWQFNENDGYVPAYLIKCAVSEDGIHWKREKENCIEYKNVHEAIGRPCVIKENGKYYMWYSYRDTRDFRRNKDNAYMIGFATSNDGKVWTRRDDEVGINKSESGWDSEMMCYSSVIGIGDELVMFYNGNEHGKYALGYATCKKKELEEIV